jgi:esterase/lipase superfamily enzyme
MGTWLAMESLQQMAIRTEGRCKDRQRHPRLADMDATSSRASSPSLAICPKFDLRLQDDRALGIEDDLGRRRRASVRSSAAEP